MYKLVSNSNQIQQITTGREHIELLPEDRARKLFMDLRTLMEDQKYYLNPFISADDVALKLNVHRNVISYVVNRCSGMSFRDFLNEFRLIEVDRQFMKKSIKKASCRGSAEMVERAGFFSISTYYRARKKRVQRCIQHDDCSFYDAGACG